MFSAKDTRTPLVVLPEYGPDRVPRLGLTRLWWLPVAVATAYAISIAFLAAAALSRGDYFPDDPWAVAGVSYGLVVVSLTFTVILLPGAVAHTWLMHMVETRRVSLMARTTIALVLSPLIGGWFLVFMLRDSPHLASIATSLWFCLGTGALFACACVGYGSRRAQML